MTYAIYAKVELSMTDDDRYLSYRTIEIFARTIVELIEKTKEKYLELSNFNWMYRDCFYVVVDTEPKKIVDHHQSDYEVLLEFLQSFLGDPQDSYDEGFRVDLNVRKNIEHTISECIKEYEHKLELKRQEMRRKEIERNNKEEFEIYLKVKKAIEGSNDN